MLPIYLPLRINILVVSTLNFCLKDKIFMSNVVHVNGGGKQGE